MYVFSLLGSNCMSDVTICNIKNQITCIVNIHFGNSLTQLLDT